MRRGLRSRRSRTRGGTGSRTTLVQNQALECFGPQFNPVSNGHNTPSMGMTAPFHFPLCVDSGGEERQRDKVGRGGVGLREGGLGYARPPSPPAPPQSPPNGSSALSCPSVPPPLPPRRPSSALTAAAPALPRGPIRPPRPPTPVPALTSKDGETQAETEDDHMSM